nr:nitrate reductase molybdenum cofactor assembly chaperone [Virgibacillus sp. MSJ-26]
MISFLLRYPESHIISTFSELENEIEALETDDIKSKLKSFIIESSHLPFDDLVNHYINLFDFGRLTNLYVTYLKLGEQRERGLELLKLKKFYEAAGFDLTDEELPDYLPLMLEFCANVSIEKSNELLKQHLKELEFIRQKLRENKSQYAYLFDVLFLNMENNGCVFELENELEVTSRVKGAKV